jgi:hypothetical protein
VLLAFGAAWLFFLVAAAEVHSVHGRYVAATKAYWLKHDPHVNLRRETRVWLEECSERLIADALQESRRPAATMPIADMTVSRPEAAWGLTSSRPAPMVSCSPRQAEFLAKAWMEHLGRPVRSRPGPAQGSSGRPGRRPHRG